jgi:hypothetical protein
LRYYNSHYDICKSFLPKKLGGIPRGREVIKRPEMCSKTSVSIKIAAKLAARSSQTMKAIEQLAVVLREGVVTMDGESEGF